MKFFKLFVLPYAIVMVVIVFIVALAARSVRTSSRVDEPNVIMEVADPSLEQFAPMWQKEIGRRFPKAVGVLCHGGNFVGDQWIVSAQQFGQMVTAQDLIRYEQAKYPNRTIVLLACNVGHLHLNIPGVYYFNSSVWCVPDRFLTPAMFTQGMAMEKLDNGYEASEATNRWDSDPDVCGNIYEAACD